MSQTVERLPYTRAVALAERIRQALAPACERIEIAGSIRRRAASVGDIELVAIPEHLPGLFPGQPGPSLLTERLEELVERRKLNPAGRNGPAWKRFSTIARRTCPPVTVDVFIVTPATWGVQMLIRTGPADFGHRCVTRRSYGGLLRDDCRIHAGRVWRLLGVDELPPTEASEAAELEAGSWYQPQHTPEEAHVFDWLAIDYLPPEDRR